MVADCISAPLAKPYNRHMLHDTIYRLTEVRALEAGAARLPLMERAGLAAAKVARELLSGRPSRVLVLAGPGNNGGDAFVVARWLKAWFFDVVVAFHGDAAKFGPGAAAAYRDWVAAGGTTISDWSDEERWGLIVDGLFGIGLIRRIDDPYAQWIVRANDTAIPILACRADSTPRPGSHKA